MLFVTPFQPLCFLAEYCAAAQLFRDMNTYFPEIAGLTEQQLHRQGETFEHVIKQILEDERLSELVELVFVDDDSKLFDIFNFEKIIYHTGGGRVWEQA